MKEKNSISIKKRISDLSRIIREDLIRFLMDMIAIPSFSGEEGDVLDRIKKEMDFLDYDETFFDGMGNLIGRIGTGNRIIALDGHCDTVRVGDLKNWRTDPFKPLRKDGQIFGRGAVDQKGGVASAVYSGKIIREIGLGGEFSLYVVASVLEEDFEGLCWKHLIQEEGIVPELVILTEPSDLNIMIGHRGRLEIKVIICGRSCHGSVPEMGDNAIYRAAPVIKDIQTLNNRMKYSPFLGKGTIAVTNITSSAPSLCAVPDRVTIHIDRRLTAGECLKSAVQEVNNLYSIRNTGAEVFVPEYDVVSHTGLRISCDGYYPMWRMKENDPLIQTAVEIFNSQFGEKPEIGTWRFSTNGVATKGIFDIPTFGLGPGKEQLAHTNDERVKEDDLIRAVEFYSAFVFAYTS